MNIQDLSVFGICDKQLACHSCRINFITSLDKIKLPSEDELDVLSDLGKLYRQGSTRMSCQVKVQAEMEGALIEIPRSAFAFFDKMNNKDND